MPSTPSTTRPTQNGKGNELAVLAGYCMLRLSPTTISRSGRDILQLDLWDRERDRLNWACQILNRHLPKGRTGRPLKVSWQKGRNQGAIHITGQRANKLVELLSPYLKNTDIGSRLRQLVP